MNVIVLQHKIKKVQTGCFKKERKPFRLRISFHMFYVIYFNFSSVRVKTQL